MSKRSSRRPFATQQSLRITPEEPHGQGGVGGACSGTETPVGAVCDPAAQPYFELSHAELLRIAGDGARVVHPGAARLALEHRVPLHVYSYRAPFDGVNGAAFW